MGPPHYMCPPCTRASTLSNHIFIVYSLGLIFGPIYTCMAYNMSNTPTTPPCSARRDNIYSFDPGVITPPPQMSPLCTPLVNPYAWESRPSLDDPPHLSYKLPSYKIVIIWHTYSSPIFTCPRIAHNLVAYWSITAIKVGIYHNIGCLVGVG